MSVIVENIETGETEVLGDSGVLPSGWRVKEFVSDRIKHESIEDKQKGARLAVLATKLGLPVPQLLDAARWLLQKDCPYCQLGTQVLRRIDELGEEKAQELVARVLAAKTSNNKQELLKIREEMLNG